MLNNVMLNLIQHLIKQGLRVGPAMTQGNVMLNNVIPGTDPGLFQGLFIRDAESSTQR